MTIRKTLNWLIDEIDKREHIFVKRSEKDIDQALAQIKETLLEALPKKLDMWFSYIGIREERQHYKNGFNDCLSQVKQAIDLMFR